MALDYTRKTSRSGVDFMDILHVLLGIIIFVLFLIAVLDTDHNKKLFPVIFFLASVMNGADGIYKIRNLPHGKKNFTGVIVSFLLTLVLLCVAAVTAVTLYL